MFYEFQQMQFEKQWFKLKKYANHAESALSVIFRSMWHLTGQTAGLTRSCFSLIRNASLPVSQDVRRMHFPLQASFGAIRSIVGIIIRRQGMSGG